MIGNKPSLHAFTTTVYSKDKRPQTIHHDTLHSVHHGYVFQRADGSQTLVSAACVDMMETVKNATSEPVGLA